MAKAKQLPSGNWRVQAKATVNGQVLRRSFTSSTAKSAERSAEEWQSHLRFIGSDFTKMTVKEAILFYVETNENKLSPTTVREYLRIADRDMQDIINKPLYSISCPLIDASINKALERLSPKTIKNRYGLLQRVLSVYHPSFIWAVHYPQRSKPKKKMYSNEYISQILQAAKNSNFELEIYLGLLSMRESEICGLKWEDVSLPQKMLTICRKKVRNKKGEYVIVENNKTYDSSRDIYLPDYVCHLLEERKEHQQGEFVTNISPHSFWDKLKYILESQGIEPTSFHSLRHMYSSVSSSLGIDAQIRMQNGGWSSEKIMDGNYRHAISESQIDANKKMNDYINNAANIDQKRHTKWHTGSRKRLKIVRFASF